MTISRAADFARGRARMISTGNGSPACGGSQTFRRQTVPRRERGGMTNEIRRVASNRLASRYVMFTPRLKALPVIATAMKRKNQPPLVR